MPEESTESAPGIGMLTERPFSRPHFQEGVAPTGAPGAELGAQARHRWSAGVARRAVSAAVGREIKTERELQEALEEFRSERVERYLSTFFNTPDSLWTRERVSAQTEYLLSLQDDEGLGLDTDGPDYKATQRVIQSLGRKANQLASVRTEQGAAALGGQGELGQIQNFRAGLASGAGMNENVRGERARVSGDLARRQAQELIAVGRRLAPRGGRALLRRLMYNGALYARFQLGLEPDWYANLSRKEQDLEDAKLQLARAAYYKNTFAGQAEKLVENPDIYFRMEQMESLYKVPGVRRAMEWYVAVMVNKTRFNIGGHRPAIWEISTEDEWEGIRKEMRRAVLREPQIPDGRDPTEREEETLLDNMEVDAIAWNLLYITNLVESLDSRYSPYGSGRRHGALVLASDDLRAAFHPQEKWESKFGNTGEPQSWGKFGRWGLAQFKRIKDKVGFTGAARGYRFEFTAARRVGDYWTNDRPKEKGDTRVVCVYVPECYPTTTVKSFLEETTDENGRSLFDYLRDGEEIANWSQRFGGSAPWSASYQTVKLPNAIKLGDYFTSTKVGVLEPGKINYETVAEWADPERGVETAFTRLSLGELPGRPSDEAPRLSRDEFHNLKVWAVFAAVGWRVGGVRDVAKRRPEIALGEQDKQILRRNLQQRSIGYLSEEGRIAFWGGEDLDIRDLD